MTEGSGNSGEVSRGLWRLPFVLTSILLLLSYTPRIRGNEILYTSFWSAAALLAVWQLVLFTSDRGASLRLDVSLRKQHYIQAMLQLSVFVYWGWYWRPVYDAAELIVAQILFAYVFDMLLGWTRRGHWILGFGPFPIVFSTNLFLWFRDDWFYLQFLMLGVGFVGKEFVRWHREGKTTHIFNPSAFSLGLFSLALILTGSTEVTRGFEIATTLNLAPNIYVFVFLVGLVVMYFFSITLVSALAAATLFGLSAVYFRVVGVPYFIDSEIPIAVFLGLHLLVTDPSTSPRTPSGKVVFGVLYGLLVFGLYELLGAFGAPTFYDKLLCVPLLNLGVQWIDRAVRSVQDRPGLDRLGLAFASQRANLVHMAVWVVFFTAMGVTGSTDGRHTGDSVPFWQQSCDKGLRKACERLAQIEYIYCNEGSGWSCNEIGIRNSILAAAESTSEVAVANFSRACQLGFGPGCFNVLIPFSFRRSDPENNDLRVLLREGKQILSDMSEPELFARACDHGWAFACTGSRLP